MATKGRAGGWSLRRLPLRRRLTITFGIGAASLSVLLSVTAWALTRENLLRQKEDITQSQVLSNAVAVKSGLGPDVDIEKLLGSLPSSEGAQQVVNYRGEWHAKNPVVFGRDALPETLRNLVASGRAARMHYNYAGKPYLAVGIPLPDREATYFEGVAFDKEQRALDSLALALIAASLVTTALGAGTGFFISRRALVPLAEIGKAAESIAGGQLDTRLGETADPELEVIAASFNDMAATLEARIERDARFASEVSHELRSPLMTLAASVEVLENSRDVLPERAQRALALLKADVDRFQTLVEDLLEISRFDVGAVTLFLEEVALGPYVELAIAASGYGDVPVMCEPDAMEAIVRLDKRRFARVLANLLDNARKYAGGASSVRIELIEPTDDAAERRARICVVDDGGGVPPDERELIFGRFSRGTESGKRASDTGVGLGLALVTEHLRLHGGRTWVEDRADGRPGACFVVELPVAEEDE